ncbi:MAG: hypothetical protein Q8P67_24680 [archaeon]|nr:hypothetical protein [archaeon]
MAGGTRPKKRKIHRGWKGSMKAVTERKVGLYLVNHDIGALEWKQLPSPD